MERSLLYKKINTRVDEIINKGFLEEVRTLLLRGFEKSPALKAIGYKEIAEYLNGDVDLETAIDNMKKNTRHYAKRQFTWMKRYEFAKWINIEPSEGSVILQSKVINEILSEV